MRNKQLRQLQVEVDTGFFYRELSRHIDDPSLAEIFRTMALIEDRHASQLLEKLKCTNDGVVLPSPSRRARIQVKLAAVFGWNMIFSSLITTEKTLARNAVLGARSTGEPEKTGTMNHFSILRNISNVSAGVKGGALAKLEGRHKSVGGNALRAAVLGANDGLVTNLSLIMGVVGASAGNRTIIIAGIAGLLAGAISMALGEWLSVQSSWELNKRQVEIETEELENSPEEEMLELSLIYQSKGMGKEESMAMAQKVFENRESAVDTLVREELGLDSNDPGGSPWEAALTSFLLFVCGAVLPLLPFLFISGRHPAVVSLGISVLGLFVLGAAITFYTGKNIWYSGMRQVIFGLAAAGLTFGIGKLVGSFLL
jgi:vacuolar iron transporter family protein